MDKYGARGVSSQKEDVHNAIRNIDPGLFPGAFCKIIPDYLGGRKKWCALMHADGAGTKSSLAYIYYKETGDLSVFEGIAMDSIAMNIDDLICAGADGTFLMSSTIGRNAKNIPGEIIKVIIEANEKIAERLRKYGVEIVMTGGETADVGDLVRTIIVDSTVYTTIKRKRVIDNKNIRPGMVIIGLSSFGQCEYETEYNSGIGSNGLTSARHDLLSGVYKDKYPESYNPDVDKSFIYTGKFKVTDNVPGLPLDVGRSILSPTRTYAPVLKKILRKYGKVIGGIVHCSGGGQTKCLKFGSGIRYIKDNLFDMPPLFKLIKDESGTPLKEMYKVFNMGHRMEIFVNEKYAQRIMNTVSSFGIESRIIGYTESSVSGNSMVIKSPEGDIEY